MKPNIIILGAHGMLGWQVLNQFKQMRKMMKEGDMDIDPSSFGM